MSRNLGISIIIGIFLAISLHQSSLPNRLLSYLPFHHPTTMNSTLCASLHNEILLKAWTGAGHPSSTFLTHTKTWFSHHGPAAEAVRDRLSPDLIEFLELARVVVRVVNEANPYDDSFWVNFHYNTPGLNEPEQMWFWHENDGEAVGDWGEGSEWRLLTLYGAYHDVASHAVGVVWDQKRGEAVWEWSLHDSSKYEMISIMGR